MASLNDSPGDFGIDNVELEGDQDLMVASRDFERLASSCYKVINQYPLSPNYIFVPLYRVGMWKVWRQGRARASRKALAVGLPVDWQLPLLGPF